MLKHLHLVVALLLCCTGIGSARTIVVNRASDMAQSGTYRITKNLKASHIKIGDRSTIIFEGGRITGAAISAKNLKIIAPDENVCFLNCTFAGSVVDSELKATNFGCVADLSTLYKKWTYKNLPQQHIGYRMGSDNHKALTQIATFLSGSSNVDFEWNGAFFSAHQASAAKYAPPHITIYGANRLTMHGGTLISGLRLINCNRVEVKNMIFAGYHECHDFPAIHTAGSPQKPLTVNGVTYTTTAKNGKLDWADNCYYYGTDGTQPLGLAAEALIFDTSAPDKSSTEINVHDCHFEMRLNGVVMGMKRTDYSQAGTISHARIADCSFSHIYFQPIGLHAQYVTVDNVSGDYALQPIDISTCSHHVTVSNASFTDLFYGPKQEATTQYAHLSYANKIENSRFTVNGKYRLIGYDSYALNVAEGRTGDTFVAENTRFEFSTSTYGSMVVRTCAHAVKFSNCTFSIHLSPQMEAPQPFCIMSIFAAFATQNTKPKVELNNTDVELNFTPLPGKKATANAFAYFFSKIGGKYYAASLRDCHIYGSAKVEWSMFEQMDSLEIINSNITIGGCDRHGYYINAPKYLKIDNSTINAPLGKYNTLVGMPAHNNYRHSITNTTIHPSIKKIFTTTPKKSQSTLKNIKTAK